ncbi:MAG: exodeoxyribonuclease V subunit beta [Desulfobacterales bacterium]|nr:exodeoxyribonuclease V subunit beta [Desulfobacterales bacterium]
MKPFDLANSPLAGTFLIEASAGTGKTYTIAGLYLRLILEERLLPGQILVVTFTKAATAEIKDRIRNKLLQAKSAFLSGSSTDDFVDTIVKKHDNPPLAVQLIQDALFDFDKSAVFTIHGFCQRILQENAFEAQSLFDTELVTDPSDLTQEIVDDFWRNRFYTLPPEFISYALQKISGPEFFLRLLDQKKAPEIKIVPDVEQPALTSLDDFRKIFNTLKDLWPVSRTGVMQLLKAAALNEKVYGSIKTKAEQPGVSARDLKVVSMAEAMDRYVDAKCTGFPLFENFEKFTVTKLITSTRKNHTPPSHELFDLCEELYQKGVGLEKEMERYLLFLKSECFKFVETELSARKKQANIQFFDDLLLMVKRALEDKGGNALAAAIANKYRAALVDEFQDTDSVQYEIFSRLFASKQNALFMIGDPKQSIYSFRGADIFSYMKAARQADSKYTLIENWRSTPALIKAVNTIFSNVQTPFIFKKIPFEEGIPGEKSKAVTGDAPLTLWYLPFDKATSLNKTEATELIAAAVAAEISRLMAVDPGGGSGHETVDIKSGDIAVLVRTNRQAKVIKTHLAAKRIPAVIYGAGNVFDTHEALEMERILASISEPVNERLFRSALVTDMMGVSGQELDLGSEEAHWWQARLGAFREYFQVWQQYGFIRMFRLMTAGEKVRGRLLSFPDGDRRLTNVLHLAEILHQESISKKLGITGLIRWLSEQTQAVLSESEVHQLRLESDEHAVKIITIHKSKGLEFPVVFCPFGWDGSLIKRKEVSFHENTENNTLTLDIDAGPNSRHRVQAQNELLAENLRLLYVALTRAKKRCYLVWGSFKTAQTSALAYLFHCDRTHADGASGDDIVSALMKSGISIKKSQEFMADLEHLANRSEGSIELVSMPLETHQEYHPRKARGQKRFCRQFTGNIDTTWKVASYSYLISKRSFDQALPDRDTYGDASRNIPAYRRDVPENADIFSFPAGTRTGLFFHDIFEHLDFASNDPAQRKKLVTDKLKAYGFDANWQAPVNTMIQKVLVTPLPSGTTPLTLSSVQCQDRINEMEFYFPLKSITPQTLKTIFKTRAGVDISADFPQRIDKLSFPLAKGFMKGYIDLVLHAKGRYFLVDWKSNFLGSRLENYDRAALNQTMHNDYYILQYHLYTLALHRYLQSRVPGYRYETDFGGVFYIFIRGVDPDFGPDFGIYKDLPAADTIAALGRALIPGG